LGGHGANHRLGSSTHSERAGSIDSEGVDRKGGGGDSGSDTSRRGAGPLRSVRYASGSSGRGGGGGGGGGQRAGGGANVLGAVLGKVGAGMGYGPDGVRTADAGAASRARRRNALAFSAADDYSSRALQSSAAKAAAVAAAAAAPLRDERRGFLKSVYRSFSRVMSAGGVLSVRPLQGLNLPHPRNHDQTLYAKVRHWGRSARRILT
jgi:hypothetical protein